MAFGELLRRLWAPGRAAFSPRAFKAKLARFAPQFGGNNQHDSQVCYATWSFHIFRLIHFLKLKLCLFGSLGTSCLFTGWTS